MGGVKYGFRIKEHVILEGSLYIVHKMIYLEFAAQSALPVRLLGKP